MLSREVGLGLGTALLVFLALSGVDLAPLLFLAALSGGLYYIVRSRGPLLKNMDIAPAAAKQKITFADIGGQAAAIRELKEALDFIKEYDRVRDLGIRPLKGILFTGPPGTGKTMLARAAAAYIDSVFLAASGSEFVEMYAGVGAQRVRKLFAGAREMARRAGKQYALIFLDEIEILGGRRGQTTSHLEYDQTLNQLLVEMDGIKAADKVRVLVVGATNRVDMLDPALLRPGRFDRQVRVELPDRQGRLEILRLHTRNKPLAGDVNLEQIARETFGFSGAHLESLANEAAILAMREGVAQIHHRHFHEAVDKVMLGEVLDRRPSRQEMYRVAVHEAGHALVSELCQPGSVSSLTITPRGMALGYMRQAPRDDTYLYTREYMENQIAVMLGGLIAEEVLLGSRSTGAGNDLKQATALARQIIQSGMSELGVVEVESLPVEILHNALSNILNRQEQRLRSLIDQYAGVVQSVAAILVEQERISGDCLRRILQQAA